MVCMGLGAGLMGVYGFFVAPLSEEFGVGAAVLNIGPVALLLVPGIVAPVAGRLADRVPIRRMMLLGVTFAMSWLILIGQASALWMAGTGFFLMVLGMTFYGPVVVNGLMVKVYPGREARALAIAAMGISFASALLPPITGALLQIVDWRTTLTVLGVVLMVVLWVAILLGIPDSGLSAEESRAEPLGRELYRQTPFWLVGFCVALAFNAAIVLAVCYPTHFATTGFTVAQAGLLIATTGMAGLMGKLIIAWLGDAGKAHVKWLAIGLLLIQVVGLVLLYLSSTLVPVVLSVMLLGFGVGAFLPMHPYLNSQYFDADVIAQVNGAQMPLFLPFGLIGAPLAGYVFDQTGSYGPVLLGLAVLLVAAAILAFKLPAARK
jgi:predicted MFS family arabinose efflux permease